MKLDFGCSGSVRSSSKSGFCSINAFSCFHWLLFRTMPPSGSVDVVVLLSGLSRSIIMKSSPLVTRTACFSYFILPDIPFLSADSSCNSHGSLSVLLSTGWLSFVPGWSAVEGSVSFWTGEEDEGNGMKHGNHFDILQDRRLVALFRLKIGRHIEDPEKLGVGDDPHLCLEKRLSAQSGIDVKEFCLSCFGGCNFSV